jgi:LacI family transcriptional regulator
MGRGGTNGGSPTIPDVARRAGVSTATAARALGGYGAVSQAARSAVLAAAEELGYRRNDLAASMITGRTQTIGLVIADIENPFFAGAVRGVSDVARAAGYDVVLTNTDEDPDVERSSVKVLLSRRVDGAASSPFPPTPCWSTTSLRRVTWCSGCSESATGGSPWSPVARARTSR